MSPHAWYGMFVHPNMKFQNFISRAMDISG